MTKLALTLYGVDAGGIYATACNSLGASIVHTMWVLTYTLRKNKRTTDDFNLVDPKTYVMYHQL
jgi:hypothetical protein